MTDAVQRFLLEQLDIRGAVVRLGPAWRSLQARRRYPPPVASLLGELAAVGTLLGSQLKTPARVTFQLQGEGPVALLVMDCDRQLRLRGMARLADDQVLPTPPGEPAGAVLPAPTLGQLIGDGRLVLTLQPDGAQSYQSVVPLEGETLAAAFAAYLARSEQQPAALHLMASAEMACGLFLQKLPGADACDADGWNRIERLAATVRAEELALPADTLLPRLFPEEDVRLFDARPVTHHCPRDEEKVREMLRSLGRDEVAEMLDDADQIAVEDEICGHEYRFGREVLDELFPPAGRVLH